MPSAPLEELGSTVNMEQAAAMAVTLGFSKRSVYNWMKHGNVRYAETALGRRVSRLDLERKLQLEIFRRKRREATVGQSQATVSGVED